MSLKVEFGLYTGGLIDITPYVKSFSSDRGKSVELTAFQTGSASVVLSNIGRDFDPSIATSTYGAYVKPSGALKITIDDTVVFTGFIRSWDFNYSIDGQSEATIQAYDAFSLLTAKDLASFTPSSTDQLVVSRVAAVLTYTGFTSDVPSTGKSWVAGGTAVTGDALSYLQTLESSEPGKFFVSKTGVPTFKNAYDSIYQTAYTYKRYNLSNNPSFESDTINWVYSGGTVNPARSTAVGTPQVAGTAKSGSYAMVIPAGSAVTHAYIGVPNTAYVYSFYAYSTATASAVLSESSLAGTAAVTTYSTATLPANAWTRLSYNYLTANTVGGSAVTSNNVGISVNQQVYVDAVLIEANATLDSYFDGSVWPANTSNSNGSVTYSGAWN